MLATKTGQHLAATANKRGYTRLTKHISVYFSALENESMLLEKMFSVFLFSLSQKEVRYCDMYNYSNSRI